MTHAAKHGLILMVILLLLVAVIGSRNLNAQAFWYDEWYSIYDSGGASYGPLSPVAVWQRVGIVDYTQVPGYFMTLAEWGNLVGWSEFAVRSLSLLTGLVAIAATYRLGLALSGKIRVGFAAAVTLSTSGLFLFLLSDARAYMQYALLASLFVWFYWRLNRGALTFFKQITFVLSAVGLLYTHAFAILVFAAIGVYHVLSVPGKKAFPGGRWWRVIWLMLVAGLCFVPWITLVLGSASALEGEHRFIISPDSMIMDVLVMFSNLGVPLLVLLALTTLRRFNQSTKLLWVWVIVFGTLGVLVSLKLGTHEPRYWIGIWPALAVTVGLGIESSGLNPTLAISFLLLFNLWMTRDPGFKERVHASTWYQPTRELVSELKGSLHDGDLVTYHPPDNIPAWTLQDPMAYYFQGMPVKLQVVESILNTYEADYISQADKLIKTASNRIWITNQLYGAPVRQVLFNQSLNKAGFQRCEELDSNQVIQAVLYERFPQTPPPAVFPFTDQISAQLVESPTITDNDLSVPILPVVLNWSVSDKVPQNTYSVGLHVTDSSGKLIAQKDYGLLSGCSASDIPLQDMSAGTYQLSLLVYKWQTGEVLAQTHILDFKLPPQ